MDIKLYKNPNDGWSPIVPKEPGNYWFYGYMWASENVEDHKRDKMRLELVKVSNVSNGMIFVTKGTFIYPHDSNERHLGLWKRVDVSETELNDKVNEFAEMFYSHQFE